MQFLGNIGQVLAYFNYTVNTFETFQWRGRQVFEAGQQFQLTNAVGSSFPGYSFQVSGYKLLLP